MTIISVTQVTLDAKFVVVCTGISEADVEHMQNSIRKFMEDPSEKFAIIFSTEEGAVQVVNASDIREIRLESGDKNENSGAVL